MFHHEGHEEPRRKNGLARRLPGSVGFVCFQAPLLAFLASLRLCVKNKQVKRQEEKS